MHLQGLVAMMSTFITAVKETFPSSQGSVFRSPCTQQATPKVIRSSGA